MLKKNIFLEKGEILIITILIMGLLLILANYFLTLTLTESRIFKSQTVSAQTYYLAEAGIAEAIWKLRNDPVWKDNFETEPGCYTWSDEFLRENLLFPNSSYRIQIQNTDCAKGQIIATSSLIFNNSQNAQRVVKVKVFKATGSLTGDAVIFSGGTSENIDIDASVLNVYDGNIFSNNNLNIGWFSDVNVFDNPLTQKTEGKTLAGNNINVSWTSSLDTTATCAKNVCQGDCIEEGCPPDSISMPMIDFDSSDSNSYKSKAQSAQTNGECHILCNGVECSNKCVLTESDFKNLLWDVGEDGTLELDNEITYITGGMELKGGRRLLVNGILIADKTIDLGERYCWRNRWDVDCGYNQLTINDPGEGKPSGLLTKSKINIGLYSSFQDVEVTGLIYANDELRIVSIPHRFVLKGGMLARKIALTSVWSSFNLYLDNSIISEGVWAGSLPPEGASPPYSPVITIDHWEEAY